MSMRESVRSDITTARIRVNKAVRKFSALLSERCVMTKARASQCGAFMIKGFLASQI